MNKKTINTVIKASIAVASVTISNAVAEEPAVQIVQQPAITLVSLYGAMDHHHMLFSEIVMETAENRIDAKIQNMKTIDKQINDYRWVFASIDR